MNKLTFTIGLCLTACVLSSAFVHGAPAAKKVDFGAVSRQATAKVEAQAKTERQARSKARQAFVYGMKEGGSTFGLWQLPLRIYEDPAIDAKVMDEARTMLREALPEPRSEKDAVRLASAELTLEDRGGDAASRKAAFAKLTSFAASVEAMEAAFAYLKRRQDHTEIFALANRLIAENRGKNDALYALGLGWRWSAALRLGDSPCVRQTRKLADALPVNDTTARYCYLTAIEEDHDPSHFAHLFAHDAAVKDKGVRIRIYTSVYRWRCQACDYAGMKKWFPICVTNCPAHHVYPPAIETMMRMRCWNDAAAYAKEYCEMRPNVPQNQKWLVQALLGCGRRDEALTCANELAANEKAKPQERFTGRMLALFASANDPGEIAPGILALRETSGAKDDAEFVDWVFAANYAAFEPLRTSDKAQWLLAARQTILDRLMWPEERVVHTVHYRKGAPRTAGLAEAAGVFDPGFFDDWQVETRFAPYQTYSWNNRAAVMRNLACKPKPQLAGVTGEGRSSELVACYDEAGVHIYMRFRDPSAASFALGEAPGCGFEFSIQTDETKGWNQMFTKTDAVKDLNEVQWDAVTFGHKPTFDMIKVDSTTTDDAYLFHTFVPWAHAYTKLPKNGDTWNTVLYVSLTAGDYVLGGGSVHEFGRGMKLKFAMDDIEARRITRAVVRRAARDFLTWRAEWENVARWKDEVLGDPEFWTGVVKDWLADREATAQAIVKTPEADCADTAYLRDWLDPQLTLDALREEWLRTRLFREPVGKPQTKTLRVGDQTRKYDLYLPSGKLRGAVVHLPGYGREKADVLEDVYYAVTDRGFAYVTPYLTKDANGKFSSNVGYPSQAKMTADDTRFLAELAETLRRDLKTDCVCLTGMSNGGEMCYQMAYRAPKAFDAIASVAGLTLETLAQKGKPQGGVRFLEIHGTDDKVSPWEGNDKGGYWGNFLSVTNAVAAVARANGCTGAPAKRSCRHVKQGEVSLWVYPCPVDTWLVRVEKGVHSYQCDRLDTWAVIMDFFENKRFFATR